MSDRILSASALVRDVADDRLTHGDITFGFGFAVIVGGGTVALIAGSLLRCLGIA